MSKNGMLTALMAEYHKSTIAYKEILSSLSQSLFEMIVDSETEDGDCRSIQTVTAHVVQSGYTYSNYINSISNRPWFEYTSPINTPEQAIEEIDKMLDFAEQSFEGIWEKSNAEIETIKFDTRWQVTYDFEQLMEHAIVHILRHRRQIENMIKQHH